MDGNAFDALTQRTAAAMSRRTSLLALGGAGLGTAGFPLAAAAGKAGKKARKKCKKQVKPCQQAVNQFCDSPENHILLPSECKEELIPCCSFLKTCNAGSATQCLFTYFTTVR